MFNKIAIVGNLGKDVDLKYLPSGMAVANFSVATNENTKGKNDEWSVTTTWFKCVVWGKQAENANKFLSKGSLVFLDGRLKEEKWQDKDGNERTSLVVNVSDIQFLNSKNSDNQNNEEPEQEAPKQKTKPSDDDVPF